MLKGKEPLFGSWMLEGFLDAGGFACAYTMRHANHPELPKAVLKAIPVNRELIDRYGGSASVERAVLHAEQEIARLIDLSHNRHMANLHNFQVLRRIGPNMDGALLLLMMDFYPQSLSDLLKAGRIAPEHMVKLLGECLLGLEAIHGNDVVHRDIKPDNIFLDDQGEAHIGDFGIAISLQQSFGSAMRAGTPVYMPPEAYAGGVLDFNGAKGLDLYALGLIGYQALEGALPFERESATRKEMVERRMKGEALRFRQPIPDDLREVLIKALHHDPRRRFPSAEAFRTALLNAKLDPPRRPAVTVPEIAPRHNRQTEDTEPLETQPLDAVAQAAPEVSTLLSGEHERLIMRELSKADRCNATVVLVLAHSESLGKTQDGPVPQAPVAALEGSLRLSDTVVPLDGGRVLVLALATIPEQADRVSGKVASILEQALGRNAAVTTGFAVFPSDAKSARELLRKAEFSRGSRKEQARKAAPPQGEAQKRALNEPEIPGYVSLVLKNAYGRQFRKLLMELDPKALHAALSRLEPGARRDFMMRIDHAVPVLKELAALFRGGAPQYRGAEQALAGCIEPMLFQRELAVRNKAHQEVMRSLENTRSLPPLPEVAMRIFELAGREDVSVDEVTQVVSRDPSLLSKILQIVNSPAYSLPAKVVDINRAVALLGVHDVMDICLGLAAASAMKNLAPSGYYNPKFIWHHSYVTGLIAVHLCKRFSPEHQSMIFTISLLHDIGKIFFAEHFREAYQNVLSNSARFDIPGHELELETFGISHAEVGKIMAEKWHFPQLVAEGIAFHHTPEKGGVAPGVSSLIGFADYLYNASVNEAEEMEEVPYVPAMLTHGQWKVIGQYAKKLNETSLQGLKNFAAETIIKHRQLLDAF